MNESTASYHKYGKWILGKLRERRYAAKGHLNAHVIEYYVEGHRQAKPRVMTPEEARLRRLASKRAWIERNPEKNASKRKAYKAKENVRIRERDRKRRIREATKLEREATRRAKSIAREAAKAAETHRRCRRCQTIQSIEEFHFAKPGDRCRRCRSCIAKAHKERYDADPESHRQRAKDYRNRAPEIAERQREHCRQYSKQNREVINARRRRRMASNPCEKIVKSLRDRLHGLVKLGKGTKVQHTRDLYGCTVEELRAHLESLFKPGMSWANYGFHGWHIDHIRPCVSFDMSDAAQQRACFHYSNLQPLWRFENQSKGSRFTGTATPPTPSASGCLPAAESEPGEREASA